MLVQLEFPGSLDKYNGQYEVNADNSWGDLLKSVVGNDYDFLFSIDEQPKPYIAIYLNSKKILDLSGHICKDNDNLVIISATSGG